MATQDVLLVRDLVKNFGKNVAVDGVSLRVPRGAVVGLLGPNGSGKSTTLHCVTGFHESSSGTITIAGHDHRSPSAKDAFGFFPDDLPFPDSLSAVELIGFHSRLRPTLDHEFAAELLDVLGLAPHLDKMLGDYSHGMRRKLQLVLALAHHPTLLILDEPLRGLDPEAAALMQSVIAEFAGGGGAVLVATHDLLAAEQEFESVVIVAEGKVVANGSPLEIIRRVGARNLTDAFVSLTGIQGRVEQAQEEVGRILSRRRKTMEGAR